MKNDALISQIFEISVLSSRGWTNYFIDKLIWKVKVYLWIEKLPQIQRVRTYFCERFFILFIISQYQSLFSTILQTQII